MEIIKISAVMALALAVFIFVIYGCSKIAHRIDFSLDKSSCQVYVNNSKVYSGRCGYVSIRSIGENGNSKHVRIYKDKFGLLPQAHYVSDMVKVER